MFHVQAPAGQPDKGDSLFQADVPEACLARKEEVEEDDKGEEHGMGNGTGDDDGGDDDD